MRTRSGGALLIAIGLAATLAIPARALAQAGTPEAQSQPAVPATLATPSAAQVTQPPEGGVNWGGAGWGAATMVADVVYVPIKLLYALLGGIVGGGAYALTAGNTQVADTIWRSALGGDYVLTPAMIQGNQPINFSGPTQTPPAKQPAVAATAPSAGAPSQAMSALPAGSAQPADRGTGPVAPDHSIE